MRGRGKDWKFLMMLAAAPVAPELHETFSMVRAAWAEADCVCRFAD
jgi:hypothetical protein